MNLTSIAEADHFAEQAHLEREDAEDRARYAEDLADALALDRLVLVRHDWAPPSWTITYQGQVVGEVTNERDDAVIGGWMAHPLEGGPIGPHHTARAAAAALIGHPTTAATGRRSIARHDTAH
jgi:hypothetical protein